MRRSHCVKTLTSKGNAHVIGLGLIGSSLSLALAQDGWSVTGWDRDQAICDDATSIGIEISEVFGDSDLVFVCVPAGSVVEVVDSVTSALMSPEAIVSDVAGIKSTIVEAVKDPRFIGGHPMAGSELRGPRGASGELFRGCNWILTPTSGTPPELYSRLHAILRSLEANVVAIEPEQHDRLMAVASHVPHLVAGALMNEASDSSQHDAVLLQLAAGGFRDMTRIAAGDPSIWPDVLIENKVAVKDTLTSVVSRLSSLISAIEAQERGELYNLLSNASKARRELPGRATRSEELVYLRIELSDEPGQLARVTLRASELLVNIYDIEIAHSASESFGTLLIAVDAEAGPRLVSALSNDGFKVGNS